MRRRLLPVAQVMGALVQKIDVVTPTLGLAIEPTSSTRVAWWQEQPPTTTTRPE